MIEAGLARRRHTRAWIGAGLLAAGVLIATAPALMTGRTSYVVGAKSFSEQYILGELMADRLRGEGASVTVRAGLGSMVAFKALAESEIDVYVDYSGTLWANVMGRQETLAPAALNGALASWLKAEHGIVMLGALGFENAYALAMRRDRADALGIRTMADLARHAPTLRMGGDFEFFSRPEWRAIRDAYGLVFRDRRQFQSTFMYQAVASGEVDVISAFSSDGRIAAFDLVVLEDPKQVVLPYDAVVLLAPSRARDATLRRALQPLIGAIDIESMREASLMVDRDEDKKSPSQAARWLEKRMSGE